MSTTTFSLPASVESILSSNKSAGAILQDVLPAVGEELQADRCFLYLRNPKTEVGKIVFCWCKDNSVPDVTEEDFRNDTESLPEEDPLFAAALQAKPSIFIEDVQTADPSVLNKAFEDQTFGHRALIHAHLTHKGELWGILQPAIFGKPRKWTASDRSFIEAVLPRLVPFAMAYIQKLGV